MARSNERKESSILKYNKTINVPDITHYNRS